MKLILNHKMHYLIVFVGLLQSSPQVQASDTIRRRPAELPAVTVVGTGSNLGRIAGSASVITREAFRLRRPREAAELLRTVPGVTVRDEEGLGLRPNIGVRGTNPTRSSKVLLLEDGVPFTIAPYGDNATYYHPTVDRFDRIEVLKGSGQILYGPQTVGAVINYLTPELGPNWAGELTSTVGSRGFLNLTGRASGHLGSTLGLLEVLRKQGDGSRENIGTELNDAGIKVRVPLASQGLTVRANLHRERSRTTYSGLTEAEYAANPWQNPFQNDSMLLSRTAVTVNHRANLGAMATLSTTLYGYIVSRNWWRQSSNSLQRPNDASDPACAGLVNLSTTCGNEGRLRGYRVIGWEPRFHAQSALGDLTIVTDAGVRLHYEDQDRRQINGNRPNARAAANDDPNGGLKEDNFRRTTAYAAYLQQRVQLGRLALTPGVRIEHIEARRTNRVGADRPTGRTSLTSVIPGFGATWFPTDGTTLFAGVHRGFAPPRTEDLLDSAGKSVDLEAETSWNYEVGVRTVLGDALRMEATGFLMDFTNQIIPASVAGGNGATLTGAGATRHAGLELAAEQFFRFGGRVPVVLSAAYTYLPTARFERERFAFLGTTAADGVGRVFAGQDAAGSRQRVSVSGNRLPYSPAHQVSAGLTVNPTAGTRVHLEAVGATKMFGDAVNTAVTSPDGQQGEVPGWLVWNTTVVQDLPRFRSEVFLAIKNLADRTYIVDRTRGIVPGLGRTVSIGLTVRS